MFLQTLYLQWKWNRDFLAFYTALGFAAPLVVLWIVTPHFAFAPTRELVMIGGVIGGASGVIAVLAGITVAWQGYGIDDRLGHIYALSLPVTRSRALALRAMGAAVTLALPATGIFVGGIVAARQLTVPATLDTYAGSLALRALLASWLAHSCIFALRYSAGRRAKTLLGFVVVLVIALGLAAALVPSSQQVMARLGDVLTSYPGPFGILFGRWTLIDV